MKKIILILIAITTLECSCNKYEEGPCFSFRSAKNRIYNVRKVESYTVDGADSIGYLTGDQTLRTDIFYDDVNSYDLFLIQGPLKDGGYLNIPWRWELQDNEKVIQVIGQNTSLSTLGIFGSGINPRWEILRLTKKELKLQTTVDGHVHKLFLKEMN